jgi:hypothetical protein
MDHRTDTLLFTLSRPAARDLAAAMARHGLRAHVTRMLWDPIYARNCIAQAHTTADAELRCLAVELFRRYEAIRGQEVHP